MLRPFLRRHLLDHVGLVHVDAQAFGMAEAQFDTLRLCLVKIAARYKETWHLTRHDNQTPDQFQSAQLRVDKPNLGQLPFAALNKCRRLSQNRAAMHLCAAVMLHELKPRIVLQTDNAIITECDA